MFDPLMIWSTWSAPFVPWLANRRTHSLPVYDLTAQKADFAVKSKHVRPLPGPQAGGVAFSAWRLAHAVKKAECTKPLIPSLARVTSLGFLLENGHLFDWSSDNLRLADEAISMLDDFSRTGLAGRVAQGMAVLCMEEQGYAFLDRFSSFCRRLSVPISTTTLGKKVVKQKAPDFVFEKDSITRALVEAKGGFVPAQGLANIKGELAGALDQLAVWGSQFNPAITKKYAIGTFLRETNDKHKEPSLIAVVDPDGQQDAEFQEVPPESVRRASYAAWLRGMGYASASQRIVASSRDEAFSARFLVGEFLDRQYAVVPLGLVSLYDASLPAEVLDFREWLFDPQYFMHRLARKGGFQLAVAAIDFGVLKGVGASSEKRKWSALLDIPLARSGDDSNSQNNGLTEGSSFADGSFVGAMSVDGWLRRSLRIETVAF